MKIILSLERLFLLTMGYDPLQCPNCKKEMLFLEMMNLKKASILIFLTIVCLIMLASSGHFSIKGSPKGELSFNIIRKTRTGQRPMRVNICLCIPNGTRQCKPFRLAHFVR